MRYNWFSICSVIREAKKFLRLPVTRMIQKRYDKLIDFESAKRSDKNVICLSIKKFSISIYVDQYWVENNLTILSLTYEINKHKNFVNIWTTSSKYSYVYSDFIWTKYRSVEWHLKQRKEDKRMKFNLI